MNATFELVPPRGTIVSSSGPGWFDASALEAGTAAEGDWLFRSEAEFHRPDRNSSRAGWGHAYRQQIDALREMSLVLAVGPNIVATCRYHGHSANSTAEPFGFAVLNCAGSGQAVLNCTGSGQSVVYQMRGSRDASPASTDYSAPNIIAGLSILPSGSGEVPHISQASIPDALVQAGESDIDINYNDFSSLADSARRNLPKRISRVGAALAVVPSIPTRTYMSDFFDESS